MEGSRYLDLAERIIAARGIPLSGGEIIGFAQEYDTLPYERYQTIVKTLQARITESISTHRNRSRFLRVAPGKYFLRRLAESDSLYSKKNWIESNTPRRKAEHPHRILTVPCRAFSAQLVDGNWDTISKLMELGVYDYQSEIKEGYIPVVTCVALYWRQQFYTFQVGVHTHFDSLSGKRSVFLRKFLDEYDLDLFETDGSGATSSSVRAVLPAIAKGRRSRLEHGKLNKYEELRFYEASELLAGQCSFISDDRESVIFASLLDLSTVCRDKPETYRRLEMNDARWQLASGLVGAFDQDSTVFLERFMSSVSRS